MTVSPTRLCSHLCVHVSAGAVHDVGAEGDDIASRTGRGLQLGELRTQCQREARTEAARLVAVGGTVILLHPPLTLVGVSIVMARGCQQNDSLADGWRPA